MTDGVADDAVRELLLGKRAQLDEELAVLTRPAAEGEGISFGKRVGEGTSMAVERLSQVAAHERLAQLRADVERAIGKLDDATYGRCDVCAEPIAPARLEALPWATRCIDHAR